MEVFINECSLEEQYDNTFDFGQSIGKFVKALNFLVNSDEEKKVYKSRHFFNSRAISGSHLGTTLKNSPSINALFNSAINRVNPKNWQDEQKHNNSTSYKIHQSEFGSTSVAEIAERVHICKNYIGGLLNFDSSSFSDLNEINITKDEGISIFVNCFSDETSTYNFLVEKGILVPTAQYDETSSFPPTDRQSILSNKDVFTPTNYPNNQGRKVYQRKGTNELWVLDNLHFGQNAHCEIFDLQSRHHIGTSLYNEIKINFNEKDNTKRIKLG